MLRTLANAWKIADLRKKILFTALVVLIFRIGAAIPVPFVAAGANGIFSDAVRNVHGIPEHDDR